MLLGTFYSQNNNFLNLIGLGITIELSGLRFRLDLFELGWLYMK